MTPKKGKQNLHVRIVNFTLQLHDELRDVTSVTKEGSLRPPQLGRKEAKEAFPHSVLMLLGTCIMQEKGWNQSLKTAECSVVGKPKSEKPQRIPRLARHLQEDPKLMRNERKERLRVR